MVCSRSFDLVAFDPDIEGTFRWRLREQWQARRHSQVEMVLEMLHFDHQVGRVQDPVVNEDDKLFVDFMLKRPTTHDIKTRFHQTSID